MMDTLTQKQKWLIGGVLLAFMLLTRPHMLSHLQDASWAIFFLAGFYLRNHIAFGVFMAVAILIDLAVVQYTNISNFCMTPSYLFIIPAYATLWFAGSFLAKQKKMGWNTVLKGAMLAVAGVASCFMITNAGFYAFSGHFETMTVFAYVQNISQYFPMFLKTTSLYLLVAVVIHWSIVQVNKLSRGNRSTSV
jgi:hypothetical protein